MFAERPVPADLYERITGLADAWRQDADIVALYLFGSRADGRATARSDVDLAVVLRDSVGLDARWQKRLGLLGDACSRLGRDAVDLLVLEDVPSVLGHRVLRSGRLLFETDPRRRNLAWESGRLKSRRERAEDPACGAHRTGGSEGSGPVARMAERPCMRAGESRWRT